MSCCWQVGAWPVGLVVFCSWPSGSALVQRRWRRFLSPARSPGIEACETQLRMSRPSSASFVLPGSALSPILASMRRSLIRSSSEHLLRSTLGLYAS